MANKKFEVQGLKELQKQLATFDKDIIKTATRKAAKAAMEPVFNRAYAAAPVDEGYLQASVKLSTGTSDGAGKDANRVGWAVVKAGGRGRADVDGKVAGEYILPAHYGTSQGGPENPFLLEAFVGHEQQTLSDYQRALSEETRKGVAKMAKRHKDK